MDNDDKIIHKIRKPIGKPVRFTYPDGEIKLGRLLDRAIVKSNPDGDNVQYWDIVDLIEFPDETETTWIRIGYYRQTGQTLNFAGQTTITEPIDLWKKLLVQAGKEKEWFGDLLREVVDEIER